MGEYAILLGEAPGPRGGNEDPLGRGTARRLATWAGFPPEIPDELVTEDYDPWRAALARRFELRNVLDRNPGKVGKGMAFPLQEARVAVRKLGLDGRTVIALGKRVASVSDAPEDYFIDKDTEHGRRVTIPHPSPINLVLNDPATRAKVGEILRAFARTDLMETTT